MEGRIKEFVYTEPIYIQPYNNHYGYGDSVGCGDSFGCGRAFVDISLNREENYSGKGILSFNNHPTYIIDGFVVYVTHMHAPWVLGEVVNNDFTTQKCYMAKVNNNYAVGRSIREVIDVMREKISTNVNNNDDIARAFVLAHPDYDKEYDWDEMVTWHSLSRFSCLDGRRNFTKYASKRSGDKATPKELISHMKNSSSRPIGEKMEKIYLHHEF